VPDSILGPKDTKKGQVHVSFQGAIVGGREDPGGDMNVNREARLTLS
jgi:hypothetical protein